MNGGFGRPGPTPWNGWLSQSISQIRSSDRWRQLRDFDGTGVAGVLEGRPIVSFASNDYLGLSHHPAVIQGAKRSLSAWGAGAGSSRLISGTRPIHSQLEDAICEWKGTQRAVVYSSGFSANLGLITAIGGPEVTIFSDSLNHASIIDGCRLSQSRVRVYDHLDNAHLQSLMQVDESPRKIIISDSIFSMDGDIADIPKLTAIAELFDAILVLDEAHAVLGPDLPFGLAASENIIRIGTLSKTLGSLGGFVACNSAFADLLINTSRPFIFSTGLSPADAGAAVSALEVLTSAEGAKLIAKLRDNVHHLASESKSQIIPVLV